MSEDTISVNSTGGDTSLQEQVIKAIDSLDWSQAEFGITSTNQEYLDVLLPLFHSLLISKLPEKQWNDILKLKKMTPWERMKARAFVKGRASAIDDVKAVLDELFEVGNE